MQEVSPLPHSPVGLNKHGLNNLGRVYWNVSTARLYEAALRRHEGMVAHEGPLVVRTGGFTGRSPGDRYLIEEPTTGDSIWWGDVNKAYSSERFDHLHERMMAYLQGRDVFVQDVWSGADPRYRIPVRIITQYAWHSIFVRNMFIHATPEELASFEPEFVVIDCPGFHASPRRDDLNSDVFILLNLEQKMVLIAATEYGGEIKKSIFSAMNYLLPEKNVMPMHCSANVGPDGDVAVFFGLSGTGKTTLSADTKRTLIGDDEHGWSDDGVFNFEGGCYAKMIRLSQEAEPEIYETARRFGTILENVVIDPHTREIDLDDDVFTENTRGAYPISFIPNASETGHTGHPDNIVFLTADAFGVLPPVARLTSEQAAHLRAGDVPLHLRIHRQGGRHRARHHRAAGDLQRLLRRPVHAAPSECVRRDAGQEDCRPRRRLLADQHRLDRRALRHRRAHEDRPHARHGARGARRNAGGGRVRRGSDLRRAGADQLP